MSSSPFNIKDLPMSAHHIKSSMVVFGAKIGFLLLTNFILTILATTLMTFYLPAPIEFSFSSSTSIVLSFLELYLIIQGILFSISFTFIILLILSWISDNAYLSSAHLITYRGLFTLDEDIYELNHLKSVKLHQSFLGRLFRYGSLKIMFASSGYHEEIVLRNLANPKLYERALKEHVKSSEGVSK